MSLAQTASDTAIQDSPESAPLPNQVSGAGAAEAPASPTTSSQPVPTTEREPQIQRILHLFVPLAVVLAERYMPVESILKITIGTIIEFDVPFDSELTLRAVNTTIGNGQAVKIGEHFGLRLSRIGTVRDRIDALGGT